MMNRFRRRVFALFVAATASTVLVAACGSPSSPGAPGSPAAPPAPRPVVAVVSFQDSMAEVYEGDTVSLAVRYETRSLAAAWRLRISPLPGTAQSADFSIPNAMVEIPAGQGTTGTVTFDLTALLDDEFEEGTETFSLRFVPDPAVHAELGGAIPISIREGGAFVSFAAGQPDAPLEVTEGDAVEVPISYQVRNLAAALELSLSPLADTAGPGEFRLEGATVTLPAGRGDSGSASVRLVAEEDTLFAEGDETGQIRFVPAETGAIGVRLGADARFVIRDGGVSPCPGVSVRAEPPTILPPAPDTPRDRGHLSTILTVTQEASAADAVLFQRSPYWIADWMPESNWRPPPAFTLVGWRAEPEGGATRHTVDLRWPSEEMLVDPTLRFGFRGGGCSGDEIATCTADGCELTTAGSATTGAGGR